MTVDRTDRTLGADDHEGADGPVRAFRDESSGSLASPEERLSIGEVAARAGVATSAIRHYESRGLLTSERTSGNQRRYARTVLRRIAVIQAAQHVGLSLAEIAEAFSRFPLDHAPTKRDWARLAREWRPRLDRRIRELEQVRDGLSMCVGCGCLSMRQCAIYNPDDALGASGSGARRVFPQPEEG